jgi:hypothetical protein
LAPADAFDDTVNEEDETLTTCKPCGGVTRNGLAAEAIVVRVRQPSPVNPATLSATNRVVRVAMTLSSAPRERRSIDHPADTE